MKKNVKKALLKAAMSVQEAMNKLGVDTVGDQDAIKKAYRDASLKNHPDRGGSKEAMQAINEAYAILKKLAKTGSSPANPSAKEDAKARTKKAIQVITTAMEQAFHPVNFTKHLDDATGLAFTESHKVQVEHDFYYLLNAEWRSGDTVFSLRASVNADQVEFVRALGGGGDDEKFSFKLYIQTSILHDNRRVKFQPREWQFTDSQKAILDPETLFPLVKIQKMIGGTGKGKRKFSKRDMLLGLEKLAGAYTGDLPFVKIPLHDNFSLIIFRSVIFKMASWDLHSVVYSPGKGQDRQTFRSQSKGGFAREDESLLQAIVDFKKKSTSVKDGQKLVNMANEAFNSTHPKSEEEAVATDVKGSSEDGYRDNDISMDIMQPLYAFLLERVNEVLVASVRDMPEKLDNANLAEAARRQIAIRVALRVLDARVAHIMEQTLGGKVDDESFEDVVTSYIDELGVRSPPAGPATPPGKVTLAKLVATDGNSDLTIRDIYDSRPGTARFEDEPTIQKKSAVNDFYGKVMNETADLSAKLNDLADEAAKAIHIKGVDNNEKIRLRTLRGQIERADGAILDIGIGII
jgi:hypothetical protein